MPTRHGGSFWKNARTYRRFNWRRTITGRQHQLREPGKPTSRCRDRSSRLSAWVAPPNRGSLNSTHIHGTHVPGGGAVHSINSARILQRRDWTLWGHLRRFHDGRSTPACPSIATDQRTWLYFSRVAGPSEQDILLKLQQQPIRDDIVGSSVRSRHRAARKGNLLLGFLIFLAMW